LVFIDEPKQSQNPAL